jgi:hypothetical protein
MKDRTPDPERQDPPAPARRRRYARTYAYQPTGGITFGGSRPLPPPSISLSHAYIGAAGREYTLTLRGFTAPQLKRVLERLAAYRKLPGPVREHLRAAHADLRVLPWEASGAGRPAGKRTRLEDDEAAEIAAIVTTMRAAPLPWHDIIAVIQRTYPEEIYDRKWNERSLRRLIGQK